MALTTLLRSQGAGFTATTLADTIDDVLITASQPVISTGVQTISTTSLTDVTGLSVTVNVETGQKVLIYWALCWSINAAANDFNFYVNQNGSDISDSLMRFNSSAYSTSGQDFTAAMLYIVESPSTGSVTYKIRCQRNSGANSIYLNFRHIGALVVRAS